MTLILLKVIGHFFCGISLNLGLFDASPRLDLRYASLAGTSQKGCCVLTASHQLEHNSHLSHYRDAHFDSLLKVVSARLLHSKVTLSPFVMNKDLVGQ